jgi:TATA-box binding protein (TBP) (component of TFIID and TFIIIB)
MCDKFTYDIVNLKIQCKIREKYIDNFIIYKCFNEENIKEHSNFWVFRKRFVYVIFYSGHVNITKLKTFSDIREALNILLLSYNFENKKCLYNDENSTCCTCVDELCSCFYKTFSKIKIDNMTVNGKFYLPVTQNILNLNVLKYTLTKEPSFVLYETNKSKYFINKVTYDLQFFPGLFLKIEKDIQINQSEIITKKWGTIILFSNGKFTLVGLQSSKHVFNILTLLLVFMFEK